jgi:DNA-binding CsgD family transcriptional regulator
MKAVAAGYWTGTPGAPISPARHPGATRPGLCAVLWGAGTTLMAKSVPKKTLVQLRDSARASRPAQRLKPGSIQSGPPSRRDVLTPRERAVLMQIGRGASSREAGEALGVSVRTIEFHRANIMRKLGAKGVVDLMLLALRDNANC